jgi:hypothetical protein
VSYVESTAELQAELAAWKAALVKIRSGQEVQIGGQRLTRANIAEVKDEIRRLVADLSRRTNGCKTAPVFVQTR